MSICHFLAVCVKDICTESSKLAAVEMFYSLLILLLTSNQHSPTQTHPIIFKAKILRDYYVVKIIWTIEVLTNMEASCLWYFALFENIWRFRCPGLCWSITNVGWAWICTIEIVQLLLRLLFTNVFVMKIISAIILKIKIKNIHWSSAILGKIVEYISNILDDKNLFSGWL